MVAAPVRVATSTIRSGFISAAADKPSARTNLPSASVFRTSTDLPFRILITSSGRCAVPEGMFSARHNHAVTRTGRPSFAIATIAWNEVAAPVMSYFMPTIDSEGFKLRPPVSKVIPLPTRARCFFEPFGLYSNFTSLGGRLEPMPTAKMPPKPSLARAFSSQTVALIGRPLI